MMVIILLYEFSPLKLFSDITHNVHKCIFPGAMDCQKQKANFVCWQSAVYHHCDYFQNTFWYSFLWDVYSTQTFACSYAIMQSIRACLTLTPSHCSPCTGSAVEWEHATGEQSCRPGPGHHSGRHTQLQQQQLQHCCQETQVVQVSSSSYYKLANSVSFVPGGRRST